MVSTSCILRAGLPCYSKSISNFVQALTQLNKVSKQHPILSIRMFQNIYSSRKSNICIMMCGDTNTLIWMSLVERMEEDFTNWNRWNWLVLKQMVPFHRSPWWLTLYTFHHNWDELPTCSEWHSQWCCELTLRIESVGQGNIEFDHWLALVPTSCKQTVCNNIANLSLALVVLILSKTNL